MSKKPKTNQGDEARKNDGMRYREAAFEIRSGEGEGAEQTVSMSISSEAPVLTYAYYGGEYQRVWEILDHSPASIDMSRCKDGLVILDRHYGDQIGLMAVKIEDRKLGGPVEFCTGERAQEIKHDAVRKLRRNTSVGYRVDASKYRLEGDKGGIPVVRAMTWMPYEASFEPVPADPGVGVGRAMSEEEETNPAGQPGKERHMDPKEMAALFSRGAKFGVTAEEVQKILDDGKGRAELDALIVERQAAEAAQLKKEIEERKAQKPDRPAGVMPEAPIGAPAIVGKERKYSVINVCRALSGEQVDIGFEREMSQECGKLRGNQPKGMIIPFGALTKRTLSVSGTSSATVATLLDSSNFIELLRAEYVLGKAGVQFMTGIRGNLSIPRMSAGSTYYHVAEGGDVTASTPTLNNVPGTPHTIGALVDVTRRMMEQSTPDIEIHVRQDLYGGLLQGVQKMVFAGTGSDGEPSAITTATGINNPSVTAGTPTYAELLNFPGSIMAKNASANGQKWIGTAEVWAKLAATATNGAGSPLALDPSSDKCLGRDFLTTEDVPANSLWFGDWTKVIIPFWGAGIEIAVDNAKLFASGGLTLRAMLDYDIMVRYGQALAYNTAVTT